jgi:hypothetical protein
MNVGYIGGKENRDSFAAAAARLCVMVSCCGRHALNNSGKLRGREGRNLAILRQKLAPANKPSD